jgi:predicted nucleic acid-binding protein
MHACKSAQKLRNGVLIDSCVLMDALLKFRPNHEQASELLDQLPTLGIVCYIPSHAYFEYAVACITHVKRERTKVLAHPIDPKTLPNLRLEVVKLDNEYVNRLLQTLSGKPIPDLKSQDLIYFCIARDRGLALITEDRKLRNTARRGGIESFDTSETLEILRDRD